MGNDVQQGPEIESKCACLKVEFSPLDNEDGTFTDYWQCVHCGAAFIPKKRSY